MFVILIPVSYTHLDVYKRQVEDPAKAAATFQNSKRSMDLEMIEMIDATCDRSQLSRLDSSLIFDRNLPWPVQRVNSRFRSGLSIVRQDLRQQLGAHGSLPFGIPCSRRRLSLDINVDRVKGFVADVLDRVLAVSYTHLDVYKRQVRLSPDTNQPERSCLFWLGPTGNFGYAGYGVQVVDVRE